MAKGKALGAKVEVYSVSSHEAVEEQVSAMESLISRKVDAIILAAVDSKGLARGWRPGPVFARNARVRGSPYDWPSLFTGMVAFAGYPLLIEGKLVGVLGMFRAQTTESGDSRGPRGGG